MGTESQTQAISEIIAWLEQQVRQGREAQEESQRELEQVRRQMHELAEQVVGAERAARQVEPSLTPFKHLPEKLREIEEGTEQIRQSISANRSALDNTIRILQAEAEYGRGERSEVYKRIEDATSKLGLILSDVAQVQQQTSQAGQAVQTIVERQREVEQRVEQYGLRMDRVIEVNRDLEASIREGLTSEQEERFDMVFERLQVVGEMLKRGEDAIATAMAEQTMREQVVQEIAVFREEHGRIDGRLNMLEETTEAILKKVDGLHSEIVLLEGRHSGLGERVGGIRREVAEVVDHVRDEFAKYNQMMEKHRRKQIETLEQELREMKFHTLRPPEEP